MAERDKRREDTRDKRREDTLMAVPLFTYDPDGGYLCIETTQDPDLYPRRPKLFSISCVSDDELHGTGVS